MGSLCSREAVHLKIPAQPTPSASDIKSLYRSNSPYKTEFIPVYPNSLQNDISVLPFDDRDFDSICEEGQVRLLAQPRKGHLDFLIKRQCPRHLGQHHHRYGPETASDESRRLEWTG